MDAWLILRIPADSRATLDALLGRIYLLAIGGEAELVRCGQQLCGDGRGGTAAGCPLVLLVAFHSESAARRFLESNAALLGVAIDRPVLMVEVKHSTSALFPPLFA